YCGCPAVVWSRILQRVAGTTMIVAKFLSRRTGSVSQYVGDPFANEIHLRRDALVFALSSDPVERSLRDLFLKFISPEAVLCNQVHRGRARHQRPSLRSREQRREKMRRVDFGELPSARPVA